MSYFYRPSVEYKCFNDCRQEGCPGHKLRVIDHCTSDVRIVEIDGKNEYWFDYNMFQAMMKSYNEGKR